MMLVMGIVLLLHNQNHHLLTHLNQEVMCILHGQKLTWLLDIRFSQVQQHLVHIIFLIK